MRSTSAAASGCSAAVVEAGVPALVYASSVGAYSPGPKDRAVDESWPTGGIASSFYSRHKAAVERLLDRVEREHPRLRVVRLRPGSDLQARGRHRDPPAVPRSVRAGRADAARADPDRAGAPGPALSGGALARRRRGLPAGGARRRLAGAFNIAAEPVIGVRASWPRHSRARPVRAPVAAVRALAAASYALRLQPTEPGWLDMALSVPVMSTERARTVLGWTPRHSSLEALSGTAGRPA